MMKQHYDNYSETDHNVWQTLFERQTNNLQDKACQDYLDCLQILSPVLHANRIPDFDELDEVLGNQTGWTIEVVPGHIPVRDFFALLAQKKFPSSTWLRSMDQLDYLEEPDMFHDIYGHIPLLAPCINDKRSTLTSPFNQRSVSFVTSWFIPASGTRGAYKELHAWLAPVL